MAEQKGSIKYVGTLGAIRHYQYKGLTGYYAGLKGGPTANMVKNHPNFVRTRENNKEFGGCARFGKSIRHSFGDLMKRLGDGGLTSRLVMISKCININDTKSIRGQRSFLLSENKSILNDLELNIENPFDTSVTLTYHQRSMNRNSNKLVTTPFCPKDSLKLPNGATHFRWLVAIGYVSDFKYDSLLDSYKSCTADDPPKHQITYSDYLSINDVIMPLTLSADCNVEELSSSITTLHVMGVEFYKLIGTRYERVNSGGVLKIVFVG